MTYIISFHHAALQGHVIAGIGRHDLPDSRFTYVADRKGHDMRYAIDPTKIHNDLSWLRIRSLKTALKRQYAGIWTTSPGGRKLSRANIRITMQKCMGTDHERFRRLILFFNKKKILFIEKAPHKASPPLCESTEDVSYSFRRAYALLKVDFVYF